MENVLWKEGFFHDICLSSEVNEKRIELGMISHVELLVHRHTFLPCIPLTFLGAVTGIH